MTKYTGSRAGTSARSNFDVEANLKSFLRSAGNLAVCRDVNLFAVIFWILCHFGTSSGQIKVLLSCPGSIGRY
jgi:hypothetical protein